jgi:hypothetical protein
MRASDNQWMNFSPLLATPYIHYLLLAFCYPFPVLIIFGAHYLLPQDLTVENTFSNQPYIFPSWRTIWSKCARCVLMFPEKFWSGMGYPRSMQGSFCLIGQPHWAINLQYISPYFSVWEPRNEVRCTQILSLLLLEVSLMIICSSKYQDFTHAASDLE